MNSNQIYSFLIAVLSIPFYGYSIHTIHYTKVDSIISLGKGVEFLRDPGKKITIEDLVSGKYSLEVNKKPSFNFENTADNVWLRFNVENTANIPLFLQLGNPELDHVTCYIVKNNSILWMNQCGNKHPYYNRYLNSNKLCLPLGSEDISVYIKLQTGSSFYLPLYVGSLKALSEIHHKDDLFNGAVIGIMLVMLFYNFFLFIAVRDILYIKYCIYLFLSTFLMFHLEGLTFDLFWRNHQEYNNSHWANIIVAATAASAIWFSSSFLRIKVNAPQLKWINIILLGALLLSLYTELFGERLLANQLVQATSGVTSFYLFVTGIVLFFKGLKEAKFYILSWGFLVTGALVYILTLNGVIGINFFTLNSFQLGSMFEGVLLSFALADRINTFRREKHAAQKLAIAEAKKNEQLIRDQNIHLESEVKKRTEQLQKEMQKSEDLLLNILPQEIAEELKEKGESEARLYNHVTVLFTDFVNFTGISETLTPTELVKEIDICFKAIDEIIGHNGLEKIKTIGDAYLAVCGMPEEDKNHAVKVVRAAIDIKNYITERKKTGGKFEIRMGIHSGPLVAGIVGIKKFAYDIWGDTVNQASRMESNSEPGKINISGATYELVKNEFKCEHRGKIEAKNKGMIDMYFVE